MASASEDENPTDIENVALLDEIVNRLQGKDRDPQVIMLIGQTGAGKSAMINTIHRVLTREIVPIAKQGGGQTQSVTLDLQRYDNCGVDLETIQDVSRREKMKAIFTNLPHIVDCAGIGDEDTPKLREILELLVGGFIPKGTNIKELESKQKQFGVGCLKRIYRKAKQADKVTKIVFLQSCRTSVPGNLITCLSEVLQITDPKTCKRKYTADIFLLITMYDLVRDPSVHISNRSDDESMTLETFIEKEKELALKFNIDGALENNRIRWASFSDKIRGDNKYIETVALRFLIRMVQPVAHTAEVVEPVFGLMKNLELYMFKLSNQIKEFFLRDMQMNLSPVLLVTPILFVVVIAVMYKLLTDGF